jgi:hypothetical protein
MVHTGKDRRPDSEVPPGHRFLCNPVQAATQAGLGQMVPATLEEPIAPDPLAWGLDFTGDIELMLRTINSFVPLEQQPALAEQMATELARSTGLDRAQQL